MRPHPHIRKSIKWGGAALTVLLVVVWIGSGWNVLSYRRVSGTIVNEFVIAVGGFSWRTYTFPAGTIMSEASGWSAQRISFYMQWGLFDAHSSPGYRGASIGIWPFVLASGILSAWAFRLDHLARRRNHMNLCQNCHYDRTGLAPDAPCPECGTLNQLCAAPPPRP